jgi:hypothetical protein
MRNRKTVLMILSATAMARPGIAPAATDVSAFYVGPSGGAWGTAANWSTNPVVPINSGPGTRYLSFGANFANADGPLDVYLNGVLLDVIEPGTLGTSSRYDVIFPTPLASAGTVDLVADGTGASVTVTNYVAVVPEPAVMSGLIGAAWLPGRRRRSVRRWAPV